ncbi:MAG: CDP-alcohol phosphatidyltransferase family protein [Staphylothermus sp.]|nr:CDP-alcohol phosphatidyltransferase family protein [Staphylothermus sp.]
MLTRLRRLLSKHILTLGEHIARTGLSPNIITLLTLLFSILAFLSAALYSSSILLFTFILLSSIMDVLDGAVARASGKTTRFGAFLDSTVDRLADALIIYSLKFLGFSTDLIFILIIVSLMISYTRSRAESLGIKMEGVGLIERAERLIIIMLIVLFSMLNQTIALILLYLLVILSLITLIQRIVYAYKTLRT